MSIITSISTAIEKLSVPVMDLGLDNYPISPATIATGAAVLGGSYLLLANLYDIHQPKEFRNIPKLNAWQQMYYQFAGTTFAKRYDETMRAVQEKSGISRVKQLGRTTVFLSSPEYAKEMLTHTEAYPKLLPTEQVPHGAMSRWIGVNLVFSNGDVWRRHRRVYNPAFHKSWSTTIFGEVGDTLIKKMDTSMGGTMKDVYDVMQRATLDALGKAVYDFEFDSINNPNGEYVKIYHRVREGSFNALYLIAPWLERIPLFRRTNLFKAINKFNEMILGIIENKRKKIRANAGKDLGLNDKDKDLLTMMIEASDEEGVLSDEELRANVVILFLAGHDTTAGSLTSALYYIAKLPEVQERLYDEVSSFLGPSTAANGTPTPTLEQTKHFNYLTAVMKEAMRINPSVRILPGRTVTTPTAIGPYIITPGSSIEVNIYSIHHNPKYWDEPEMFRAERFLDASADGESTGGKRDLLSWVPFSYGTRACIGMNFSLIEQRVILAMLVHKYKFSLPPDTKHKDGIVYGGKSTNMRPDHLNLTFTPRY